MSLFKKIYFISLTISVLIVAIGCKKKNAGEGEKLAKIYCASCHQFPEPSLIPKNVWEHSTLPYMSILLGVKAEIAKLKEPIKSYSLLQPENQTIGNDDWQKIKDFYLDQSPDELKRPKYEPLGSIDALFTPEIINTKSQNTTIPNFTLVAFDTENQIIIAGDQSNRLLWLLDKNGQILQTIKDQDAITNIDFSKAKIQEYLFTYMGKTTQANQESVGKAVKVVAKDKSFSINEILLSGLNRPVMTSLANLDKDIDNEIVVSEFGFRDSGLSLWKKDKKGLFTKKYLSQTTGAIKTIIKDFNGDKLLDIMALFAQGDERIVLYTNKGNLNFEEQLLLRFPPIYGSSSFELADVNKDGKEDIIYTCGDNADFTTILKPYHGVYVFENEGNNKFKKTNFFYQNGAYKSISKDFDNDGDVDIVSISLFPDVNNRPQESFLFFENTGENFKAKTLNINHLGRWAVIDAGDIDRDGDIDLVLGSHAVAKFPSGFDQAWEESSGLLILRNNSKK